MHIKITTQLLSNKRSQEINVEKNRLLLEIKMLKRGIKNDRQIKR